LKSGSVFIGVAKIWLDIPACKSLKEKRGVIKPLLSKLRDRFQVAAAEIGHHDAWNSSVIGVSLLGNRGQDIEKYLQSVIESVLRNRRARLIDYKTEILSAGGVDLSPEFNPLGDKLLRSVEETWIESDEEDTGS